MKSIKIGIIGLGYVGLPLAVEFSKFYKTVGYDINKSRINELLQQKDSTKEVTSDQLKSAALNKLMFTDDNHFLKECDILIITVPTPLDESLKPDLTYLEKASELIGKIIKKNAIVVYESTTYPGCTQEFCVPIVEKTSGLKANKDFYFGYSPERIVPGDKVNTLTTIKKVVSGSNQKTAETLKCVYEKIITAGVHVASSIKVAEASKAIENAQRDLNISFVNELSIIFHRMGIDTSEVLAAAGTKWNFLKYSPGLVGGHCISVDPYYLTYKSEMLGYTPDVILSGRRVNEGMPAFIANTTIKALFRKKLDLSSVKGIILGVTFKENCPDIRNSKVVELYKQLKTYNLDFDVYDPFADAKEVKKEYKINLLNQDLCIKNYNVIIIAVGHAPFKLLEIKTNPNTLVFDLKGILPKEHSDLRL